MTFRKWPDSRDRKQVSGCQGLGRGDGLLMGVRGHFRLIEMLYVVTVGLQTT